MKRALLDGMHAGVREDMILKARRQALGTAVLVTGSSSLPKMLRTAEQIEEWLLRGEDE